jgi:putative membrane protein
MAVIRFLGIYLRGIAMGAADVVPGVSGGTVAFITGIYEELINSIKSFNFTALKTLFRDGPVSAWRYVNGSFLLVLLLGIVTSIVSLAKLITVALEQYPLLVWSLFFGLIAASSWHMFKQIRRHSLVNSLLLIAGLILAYAIAEVKPSELPARPELVFMAGAIAICAMILPGISGSFILVLLGMYAHILAAVNAMDLLTLGCFMAGAGVGILSFANLLSWLMKRFHDATFSVLTGFLLGSLYLIWPWKHVLSYYQNRHGESLALEQVNVLPGSYHQLTGADPQTLYGLLLMALGFVGVLLLEFVGKATEKTQQAK